MKQFVTVIFTIILIIGVAGEREVLLKKFEKEYSEAKKELFENAETTVDLVGAAGNCATLSKKQLFLAFDYKLRHITVASERLQIIDDFYRLSEDIQKIASVSREGRGSLFGMFIYLAESDLMQQQIAVWMLGGDDEKRWKRIANSKLISDGKEIKLDRGRASFESEKYQDKVTLELLLFPKNTFTFEGRDFAIIRTDIPFAGNDDYSTVYLCEIKNGKLQVRNTLKMAYFAKWAIQGKKLMIFGHEKEKETFSL